MILISSDICATVPNLKVCRELYKSSVTDAVSGLKLSAASIKSRLLLDVGCLLILFLNDVFQAVRKQLELSKLHQVMLLPCTEEDPPNSKGEFTLRTRLMQLIFLGVFMER